MAEIYIPDYDRGEVEEKDIGDIANLVQMEKDLDDTYEEWYWTYNEAIQEIFTHNFEKEQNED